MKSVESAVEALKVVVAEAMAAGDVHLCAAAANAIESLRMAQLSESHRSN